MNNDILKDYEDSIAQLILVAIYLCAKRSHKPFNFGTGGGVLIPQKEAPTFIIHWSAFLSTANCINFLPVELQMRY